LSMNRTCCESGDQKGCVQQPPVVNCTAWGAGVGVGMDVGAGVGVGLATGRGVTVATGVEVGATFCTTRGAEFVGVGGIDSLTFATTAGVSPAAAPAAAPGASCPRQPVNASANRRRLANPANRPAANVLTARLP